MTAHSPLILQNGRVSVLPQGDTLAAPAIGFSALPVASFGAVGNGTADDTAAVAAAMAHPGPVDWGDGVYRITAPISVTRTKAVSWRSNGAVIRYDGSTAQLAVSLDCAGVDFCLDGRLTIDANSKAFTALQISNTSATLRPAFQASGLRVENAYRASTAFTGGSGLWLLGGWRTIYLERFGAYNCRMAAGAGIAGAQGISGLTISANSQFPDEITIVHPEISEIYSDDATWTADQDGIKIFTAEDSATDPMPWPTHFNVVGGRFHNCRGRSIKSQCEMGAIQGAKFVRDAGWTSGGLPTVGGYEVDFQVGGGFLIDCEYHYRDYAPQALVGFSGTRETGGIDRLSSGGTLRGAKVFLHNTPQMARLVQVSPFAADDFAVTIDDVQVISTAALVDYVARASLTSTVGDESIRIKNFRGKLATGFVNLTGGGTAIVNLHLEDSINLAAAVPVHNATSNTVNLFCRGVTGATNATQSKQGQSSYTISVAGADVASFGADGLASFAGPIDLASYLKAALPAAAASRLAFVTDHGGGAALAFSDGSAWRYLDGKAGSQGLLAPAAGVYLANGPMANALSTAAQVADRTTIAPFVPRHAITIDQLGCSISTLLAGATVKLVVYDSDGQGRPAAILGETATIDASTAGTKFAAISPLTMIPGKVYWLGLRSSAAPTIRTINVAAAYVLSATSAATPVQQTTLTKNETYASAAAAWTYAASQHSNLAPPLILMRVA